MRVQRQSFTPAAPAGRNSKGSTEMILAHEEICRIVAIFGVAVMCPIPALHAQAVPGLGAAYAMDEGSGSTLNDASNNGNTGRIRGAVWTGGRYSGALYFDGGSYVDLGQPGSLQTGGSMSWSAWIYATGEPADDGQIVARSSDANGWQLKTTPDTGQRTFGVAVSPDGQSLAQRY